MLANADIDLIVFDVLGTLVNEPGGLRDAIREPTPTDGSNPGPAPSKPLDGSRGMVYRLAVDLAGGAPERVLKVAAHAWDLRGAQAVGLRTAYVQRPVGDPPLATDSFDYHAAGLAEFVAEFLG